MSTLHMLQTVFEMAAIGFIIWGYFNQERLVSFERKIKAGIKRRKLRVKASYRSYNRHCA